MKQCSIKIQCIAEHYYTSLSKQKVTTTTTKLPFILQKDMQILAH